MIVPEPIRKKWKSLYCNGDQTEMAGEDNSLRTQISYAMNGKDCNEKVFKIIRAFYKKREQLLKTA